MRKLYLLFLMLWAATVTLHGQNIRYVKQNGTGNGSSWTAASGNLQQMINDVGSNGGGEVWVAAGTYQPASGQYFSMANNVEIYGGFAGNETNLDQRDWVANKTTLQGNGNSVVYNRYSEDNPLTNTAVLDGFTITGGNNILNGGGMCNWYASPTLTHLKISGNTATYYGGGMYNRSASPTLTNVEISGNTAEQGGGMGNSYSSPTLTNLKISGNTANEDGGGMYNDYNSSPTLTHVEISGNTASTRGGGMYNSESSSTLTNVTIAGNTPEAIALNYGGSTSLNNTIVWGDIIEVDGSYVATNSLIEGNTNTDNGNIDANGLDLEDIFANPANGDYTLADNSPAIDAGSNALYNGDINNDLDLAGNSRLSGCIVDMGAYENQSNYQDQLVCLNPDTNNILYVDKDATGTGDGSSWTNAVPELRDALDWAANNLDATTNGTLKIWVAAGTYQPEADESFTMLNNVEIYGGFAGDELANYDLDNRDFETNETTLQGNGDSVVRNEYTETNPLTNTAVLDGFTITGGNGSYSGGGMYNEYASPTLTNLKISENTATYGGGMYNWNASPTLTHIKINENTANNSGGILSSAGGGMFNDRSSPTLTHVKISENTANNFGGGMYNLNYSSPTLTNVEINENTANNGGGMYNEFSSPT